MNIWNDMEYNVLIINCVVDMKWYYNEPLFIFNKEIVKCMINKCANANSLKDLIYKIGKEHDLKIDENFKSCPVLHSKYRFKSWKFFIYKIL
jgi:hypothetical protein